MSTQRLRERLTDRSMAAALPRRLYRRLRGQLYVDLAGPAEQTLLLAGSPRSGTTWVAEMVAASGNLRLVFEPFHPGEVGLVAGWAHRQYLRPGDDEPDFAEAADQIMAGRIRSLWADRYNRRLLPRRRLVKEVRANLLLGWLRRRYPRVPIALVIRHPGAVLASQDSVGWDFRAETAQLLAQPHLVEDHLQPFEHLVRGADSASRQHLLVWCVENYVPLRQFRRGEVHLVCYEHLVTRPEVEFRRLFRFYGLPFGDRLLERVTRPSAVTTRHSALVTGGDVVQAWRDRLSGAEHDQLAETLPKFGLDRLYGSDGMPLLDDPNDLLRQ